MQQGWVRCRFAEVEPASLLLGHRHILGDGEIPPILKVPPGIGHKPVKNPLKLRSNHHAREQLGNGRLLYSLVLEVHSPGRIPLHQEDNLGRRSILVFPGALVTKGDKRLSLNLLDSKRAKLPEVNSAAVLPRKEPG